MPDRYRGGCDDGGVTTILAYVPDLMDRSKVAAAAPEVRFVDRPDDLVDAEADLVVVDLGRPGVPDVLAEVDAKVIGFGSHVDRDLLAAAEAAGCDEVLPRSRFFTQLNKLLRD